MEQAQPTPAVAPALSTNAKSIWSIVAYLSWVGALIAAYKKRDAFHMWHARTSLGVSILYLVVYAVVRVLVQAMAGAGFVDLLALLANLFGLAMFVFTIVAVLKAWKGEQWAFFGLAKMSQKIPLEKLFPADGSASPAVDLVENTVQPVSAPVVEPSVETAPVVPAEPVVAPAPTPAPTPAVEAMTEPEPAVLAPSPEAPVAAPVVTAPSAPVEVQVEQEPVASAVDLGVTIEPAVSAAPAVEAPSVPEVPAPNLAPEGPVQTENPTPPTA